ncbi:glycoside hydrolase family 35 protein, partial [Microthyrium microscopicum]
MIFTTLLFAVSLLCQLVSGAVDQHPTRAAEKESAQKLVTWDKDSFFIRGERLFIYSGEFHAFRLPVPGLWLDIFQKIKALGFNAVSFYIYWGLHEGKSGRFIDDGIWSYDEFFRAAKETGLYLIARPGPYINAETSAGGLPGWTLQIPVTQRSDNPVWYNTTVNYLDNILGIIADQQITRGGPVIMVQSENEYTGWPGLTKTEFPNMENKKYMQGVKQMFLDRGIVVPLYVNDNTVSGYFAPGTGVGELDLYGIDAYPLRYDCWNPSVWPIIRFPENWHKLHLKQSPNAPLAVTELQGGSSANWGGVDQDQCGALVNEESIRVLHKQQYSFGTRLLNIYMAYGGTNWGNLGYHGGDTSYDYGAFIGETRHVRREKYSEVKIQANFLKVTPAYLRATPGDVSNGSFVGTDKLAVTQVNATDSDTKFYIVRHADFQSREITNYRLNVFCSLGNVSIPQMAGQLTLFGRDSKIHVTDYDVGDILLRYSTAEIFTWATNRAGKTILILYGGEGEWHEFAVDQSLGKPDIPLDDPLIQLGNVPPVWLVKWKVTKSRRILRFEEADLEVHLIWRNHAYSHWTLELPAPMPIGNYSSPSKSSVVIAGGYLMRSASVSGNELHLTGDVNATTDIELLHEPTGKVMQIFFNGHDLNAAQSPEGLLKATIPWKAPSYTLPDFSATKWKYIDSLPELSDTYDDSKWTACDRATTPNPHKLQTPRSLYASDYGYHTGSMIYRGSFKANGNETSLYLLTAGGYGFGQTIFLNGTYVGMWPGSNTNMSYEATYSLPRNLKRSENYMLTILIEHFGFIESAPGNDEIKAPMGIRNYKLDGHPQSDITWKMTGNFGGEDYADLVRGPKNEGAMFAERQGYHQPKPPSATWKSVDPISEGISGAGVGFFTTEFELKVPAGYDVPMFVRLGNDTFNRDDKTSPSWRAQIYVNGYQFGKHVVSNLGPQYKYPVPEGILNHNGINTLAITIWSLRPEGASLGKLELIPDPAILSSYSKPELVSMPAWKLRPG